MNKLSQNTPALQARVTKDVDITLTALVIVWRERKNMADSSKPPVTDIFMVIVSHENINGASRSSHVL